MRRSLKIGSAVAALLVSACVFEVATPDPGPPPLAGGSFTHFNATGKAFSSPAPDLSDADLARHQDGDAAFEAKFVTAPATVNPGLGPLFNNISCGSCHLGDGRGRPPESGDALASMLFRISSTGTDSHGGPKPMPGFGGQIQTRAIFGAVKEAEVGITYHDSTLILTGGETITLRVPQYALQNPWQPLSETPLLSPRVAPPMIGLGLLEAVEEADILRRADPYDHDRDGVSGRPNFVFDVRSGATVLGRFGWKANNPNLDQQSAGAYNQDMGITNPIFPAENCSGDRFGCDTLAIDLDSATLANVAFYLRSLAVPGRRGWENPGVRHGEELFTSIGCAECHFPEMRTGPAESGLSVQTIHPYTDLLVHDMGEGLADGRPDFEADGREWRTAPLWGIGLTAVVNGHTFFLHDGRARNLLEAVLWHGGEGENAKNAVRQMPTSERTDLIRFLESL